MIIRFVVDERSIDLNGLNGEAGLEVIQVLLDRIEDARLNGHGVCYDDDLFSIALVENRSFWELCDVQSPIYLPPDVQQRAAAAFGTMPRWYEVDAPQPVDFDVRVDGGAVETTASVAWAHHQSISAGLGSPACICATGRRRTGVVVVEVSGQAREVCFVASAHDVEKYFRWLIAKYAATPDEIAELALSAFTQLQFIDRCFDGIRKMSKPFRQLAPTIVKHLAAFSDEGRRIFSGPWVRVPTEFGSLGIDISDENGNTKKNSQARKERQIVMDGEELFFWWHSKIEPHQDRIHICPDKVREGGQIVVGIFCLHLTS
jgi:hypothetical protein